MEMYDNTDNCGRLHTLAITLQMREYKGIVALQIGGNCLGYDILTTFHPSYLDERNFIYNDCNLKIDEDEDGNEFFTCNLKHGDNELFVFDNIEFLSSMVVRLEIVECEIE